MKTTKLLLVIAVIASGFTSCKNEKETKAEKTVDNYVVYVDSLGNVNSEDSKNNWSAIESSYKARTIEAETALADFKDKMKAEERVRASKAKYESMKAKVEEQVKAQKKVVVTTNPKQKLRNIFFGSGKIGEDMNFNWVNKDNILKVYDAFFQSYKDNKANFSREDYDEVKLMYEALDSRKNTVEKEGLTPEDNRKIASIKFKFAPMFKINRIGAKSRENAEAKE